MMDYQNKNLSPLERAEDLVKHLTLKEKILQLAQNLPNGISRLGVPHLQSGECLHGVRLDEATSFPQAIAMGATWNPSLIEEVATTIAKEARALGVHHCNTPMLGVLRDIRWGRTEEGYGEDPYLVSEIGVAFVKGLQGMGTERYTRDRVCATAKHYVADGEYLSGNNGAAVEISERILREVHLPPFEAVIKKANLSAIMPAHHSLNGVPCHANKWILTDILRDEYGFDGYVVTDNNDIRCLETLMLTAENLQDGAIQAMEAGVDRELVVMTPMGDNRAFGLPLYQAVLDGKTSEDTLDKAVIRTLKIKFEMGLFEDEEAIALAATHDFYDFATEENEIDLHQDLRRSQDIPRPNYKNVLYNEETNQLAKKCADDAIILLKNENNLLPLNKNKIKHLGVIGPNANAQVLGGYSTFNPRYYVTGLEGLEQAVSSDCEIHYAEGCDSVGFAMKDLEEALQVARDSEVVILFAGGNEMTCKENQDIDFLEFVGDQSELIKAVYAENPNIVLVLLHGRPNSIPWEKEHIPAIIEGFYLGQETGNAIADALFGITNPSGKLPLTIPRNAGQCPAYYNKLPFGRFPNYYNSSHLPLYPFGYGLSYTTFHISEPDISQTDIPIGEDVHISVTVENTGERAGSEVIQLYIHDDFSAVTRPSKELKGFQKVYLEPGESKTLTFCLTKRDLSFFLDGDWCCEKGSFTVMVGNSSETYKSSSFTLI